MFIKKMKKGFAVLLAVSLAAAPAMESAKITISAKKTAAGKKAKTIQVKSPLSAKDKTVTTTLTLKKGSTFKIKTGVSPKSAGKKLVYKSSKKKIATVSKSGKIKAKKVGKTNITICPKGNKKVKAVIKVTVVKKLKKVKKIALDKSSLSLSVGGSNSSAQLKASVVSPKKPTVKKFNWFTSNKKVAAVSKTGKVTAKKVGSATITVTSADGRGAKAVCRVTVTEGKGPNPPAPTPATELTVATKRTGIKQGESLQMKAEGPGADQVSWTVSELTGVTMSTDGLLTVASTVGKGKEITVTVTTSADVKVKTATKKLTVVEDINEPMAEDDIQINVDTKANPYGLTYRSDKAYSEYEDAERGDVIRFDAREGYTSSANDVLAWMVVNPEYAGKTVTFSGYLKYEAQEGDLTDGVMNLIVNEGWRRSNPFYKYNANPGEWYRVSGTYKMTSDPAGYDGTRNRFYITRSADHLKAGVNVVYYLDDLRFTVKKSVVESVTLSTKNDAESLYQNHTLQFNSVVSGQNSPVQKTKYEIVPAVAGASIDEDGLLTVGNVAAGTAITVKATSVEDESKSATKTVTVLAQTVDKVAVAPELTVTATSKFDEKQTGEYKITVRINKIVGVTISTAANKKIVSSELPLTLSAEVEKVGTLSGDAKWSIQSENVGATLASSQGVINKLSVTADVAVNTVITVRATSVEDASKYKDIDITVVADSEGFDINKLSVDKWEDFAGLQEGATIHEQANTLLSELGISCQSTIPEGWENQTIANNTYPNATIAYGLEPLDTANKNGVICLLGAPEDYVQFSITNDGKQNKTYQLSFMLRFQSIAAETAGASSTYELPLKLVSVNSNGEESVIKDTITLPYRCYATSPSYYRAFYEVLSAVEIPAGETVRLRLKMNGALPGCPSSKHTDLVHPVECGIDNIAITSGKESTISMKVGDQKSIGEIDVLEDDTVQYYTNSYLTKYTHDNSLRSNKACSCNKFDTVIANVDEKGLITAETPGDTSVFAVITHKDGSVERKHCIVHVEA